MNQTNELKPMKIGDVLDYSIVIFKSNFKAFALLILILYIPWVLIQSFISSRVLGNQLQGLINIFNSGFLENYNENIDSLNSMQDNILSNLLNLLSICYGITIKLVLNAAIIKIVYDFVVKNKNEINSFKDVKRTIKESFKFLPRMMGNASLFNLIIYGVYFVSAIPGIFILVFMAVIVAQAAVTTDFFIGLFIVLFSLIVIPVILFSLSFFWVKLIFGANAVVLENKSVSESLSRSWKLSKGHFWHIALTCLFGFIVYFLVGNMLSAASIFASLISNTLFVVLYTLTQIFSAFMYPFVLIFITVIFINIKIIKEGLDLEVKVDKLLIEQSTQNTNAGGDDVDA